MTYSFGDIIDLLDENDVERLIWDEKKTEGISIDRVCLLVHDKISERAFSNENKSVAIRVKSVWRIRFVAVMVALAIAAVPCYALIVGKLNRSSLLNDENKFFVGRQVNEDYYIIIDEDGHSRDSLGNEGSLEDILSINKLSDDSEIINEIEDPVLDPSSYVEFTGENEYKNGIKYPAMILINNSLCILTNDKGGGWDLDRGDSLKVNITKRDSDNARKQNLIVGYIQDGVLKKGEVFNNNKCEYVFTAETSGEYYFYLLSASSDYLTLEGARIISVD